MITPEFLTQVEVLRSPWMGTELMGPLLYSMVRSTRPTAMLEIGTGYTTPFLLQAAKDNADEFSRGRQALREKSEAALAGKPARGGEFAFGSRMADWLGAEPSLARPAFYMRDYQPMLHALDDESLSGSTAGAVADAVARLGLQQYFALHRGDFRAHRRTVEPFAPFDFVWFDCGGYDEYADFLDQYWDLVDPRGGMIALHYMTTNVELGSLVQQLKRRQASDACGSFELLSLVEPHKFRQNGCTLLRRTAASFERYVDRDAVIAESDEFLSTGLGRVAF